MAKGSFPGMGGANMQNLMRQAQRMQQEMERTQKEVAERKVEASSGGGMVKVIAFGNRTLESIELAPDVVDSDDIEMLQDLILAAVNEALRKADEMMQGEMGKFTGGMNMGF